MPKKNVRDAAARRAAALQLVIEELDRLRAAVVARYGVEPEPRRAAAETRALVDLAAVLQALRAGPGLVDAG